MYLRPTHMVLFYKCIMLYSKMFSNNIINVIYFIVYLKDDYFVSFEIYLIKYTIRYIKYYLINMEN